MLYRRLLTHRSASLVIARTLLASHHTVNAVTKAKRYSSTYSRTRVVRSKIPDLALPDNKSYVEFILDCCDQHGEATALVDGLTGRSYTYNDVSTLVKKCGSALVRAGMKKDDVFSVHLPNIIEQPLIVFGILAAGGVVSPVNPRCTTDELAYQLKDCGAKFVVTLPESVKIAKEAASKANVDNIFDSESLFQDVLNDDGTCLPNVHSSSRPDEEVVCLPYSSGTTGLPKAVMQTHTNYISHALMLGNKYFMSRRPDIEQAVVLALLPFFHASGHAFVIGLHFPLGSKLICMQQFDEEVVLRLIEEYKITDFPMVPPIALFLAKHPMVDKFDLSSLQNVLCGAAPIGKETMDSLRKRLPSIGIVKQAYGLTEATAVCTLIPSNELSTKNGSVGTVLPNVQLMIKDLHSGEALGPWEDGEICVKGPTVTKGYLNKPEQTAQTIDSDGWLHTGDIGHYDDDEYFYVVDRLKELIKYKGYQVPPALLEAILVSHPQITDAAVIGVPNEEAGELPKAFVVSKGGITEDDILQFVANKVSPEKKLRGGVEFVDAIPKTASGKILRRFFKEESAKK